MSEPLRRKTLSLDVKFLDESPDAGTVELYAAVFGNVDRAGEMIQPGAFLNLDEFNADGVGLSEHRIDELPIAIVLSAWQDEHGLRIKARFHSTPRAQEVRTVVRERKEAGKSVQCSIGYRVAQGSKQRINGREVLVIKALRVYEFSFTNLAANALAGVIDVKSAAGAAPQEEPMEDVDKRGVWASVRSWLRLDTKAGRAISRANHAELKAFATSLDELGDQGVEHAEKMLGHAKGCKAVAAAMFAHLDPHDPDKGDDDQGDAEEADGKKSAPAEDLQVLRLRLAALDLDDEALPPAA